MAKKSVYLGFDIGASNGRAVLGFLDGQKLTLKEINRFSNGPVELGGTLYWDFLSLWQAVLKSMEICNKAGYTKLSGIGIDTWGVDFGLIGNSGQLLSNPICYRDSRTEGIEKTIARKMSEKEFYRLTGLGIGRILTLSQLAARLKYDGKSALDSAKSLLFIPDLFRYFLCGQKCVDATGAGSSALADVNSRKWSTKIFKRFDIPMRIMPPIVEPGTPAGQLLPEISRQTGIKSALIGVIAGHDSLSAAAAIPTIDKNCAFLNCGTWSVLGIVSDKPVLSEEACARGFVNELGLGSVVFVKNMTGLYLFENLYRCLKQEKPELTYEEMVSYAAKAKPFEIFLNIGDPEFFLSDDPRVSVEAFLKRTRQKVRPNCGGIIRAILESLVFSYKAALKDLERLTGRTFNRISMAGGGIRNELLCRMTADATGCEIIAGPAEATIAGNIGVQAMAAGKLKGPAEIREMIRNSFKLKKYEPTNTGLWDRAFENYKTYSNVKQ